MANEITRPDNSSQFQIGGKTQLVGSEMQIPRSASIGREIRMQLPVSDSDPLKSPELFGRDLLERGGSVPIPGRDIMEDLMSVEIGEDGDLTELNEVLRRAWAYREGLAHGPSGQDAYNINASQLTKDSSMRSRVAKLQNLFYTVEGAMERPRTDYVDIAIEDALDKRIRVAQEYRQDEDKYRQKITRQLTRNFGGRINNEAIKKVVDDQVNSVSKDCLVIPQLIELSNHSKVRASFDHAFRQRMATCEDPGKAAKLGSADMPTPTPDGQHWTTLFNGEGEYGKKVNNVFEEMVKVALPDKVIARLGMTPVDKDFRKFVPENVYGVGFDNATMFATWMEYMLKKADGRMDVVWGAWKMMLTWEVADDLGQSVSSKGKYALASPPIGNPLMTYLAHWKEKTTTEFGWNAKGERTQKEKFVQHSGLPLTFGRVPNLCEQYFIEAKVGFDTTYKDKDWMKNLINNCIKNLPKKGDADYDSECFARQKYFDKLKVDLAAFRDGAKANHGGKLEDVTKINISLWDIWLYGRISFADKDFPWFATDQAEINPSIGELPTSGELPAGSVGMWYLTRGRSWGDGSVGNDLKMIPGMKDLAATNFFSSKVRTWAKVLGTVSDELPPQENVRVWWVAGIIEYHLAGNADSGHAKRKSERSFREPSKSEVFNLSAPSANDGAKSQTLGDFLGRATECSFLREQDRNYILQYFGLELRY